MPLRIFELLAVFFGVPLAARYFLPPAWQIPLFFLAVLLAFLALWRDPTFDRRQLWNARAGAAELPRLLLLALLGLCVLATLAWVLRPDHFFAFPRRRPGLYTLVMLLYPILSVYPQEVLYRAFFHHRYRAALRNPAALIVASAAAFAALHLVLRNPIAPALTFLGGLLFAFTYERSRSLAAAWLEHTLLGQAVFTTGLGFYFVLALSARLLTP